LQSQDTKCNHKLQNQPSKASIYQSLKFNSALKAAAVQHALIAILTPPHGNFYCYDILQYIVTLAILVRHVNIDNKYRTTIPYTV